MSQTSTDLFITDLFDKCNLSYVSQKDGHSIQFVSFIMNADLPVAPLGELRDDKLKK